MFGTVSVCRNIRLSKFITNQRFLSSSIKLFNADTAGVEDAPKAEDETSKVGGFAKYYEKQSQLFQEEPEQKQTFASLLRNSKLMDVSTVG